MRSGTLSAATLAVLPAVAAAQLELVHDSRESSRLVGVDTPEPTAYVRNVGEWTEYRLYFAYD